MFNKIQNTRWEGNKPGRGLSTTLAASPGPAGLPFQGAPLIRSAEKAGQAGRQVETGALAGHRPVSSDLHKLCSFSADRICYPVCF